MGGESFAIHKLQPSAYFGTDQMIGDTESVDFAFQAEVERACKQYSLLE